MDPVTVIIPASNEAALIGACLDSLLASEWPQDKPLDVVVIANGCHDDTAGIARGRESAFAARGWSLLIIDRPEGGKPGALDAGDDTVRGDGPRVYLDADVTISPRLLDRLADALSVARPRYASGRVRITAQSAVSRAYARMWGRVPFMQHGVPGCGVFAVNAAGRARWGRFPDIIADDTFVRLCFAPEERVLVDACYDWPVAEGFARLVKVRRRQDAGVSEIARKYPALAKNDDKRPFPLADKFRAALFDPMAFAVYGGVALVVRLTRKNRQEWARGR